MAHVYAAVGDSITEGCCCADGLWYICSSIGPIVDIEIDIGIDINVEIKIARTNKHGINIETKSTY